MKRVLFILLFFVLGVPGFAEESDVKLPNIFIYSMPDNEEVGQDDLVPEELEYVSPQPVEDEELFADEEIPLFTSVEQVNDKEYDEFVEDANSIFLKDEGDNYVVNLRVPQKITSNHSLKLENKIHNERLLNLSKYSKEEYNISGKSVNSIYTKGGFSIGTTYDSSIDKISMLENSTKLFTRYERERFALSSAYEKTMNTTIGRLYDTFYLAPEFKLNNYFSIREVLSADITRNRKSSELIFSVSPYGLNGTDRFRFEVGAKQTIDQNNALYGTQLNFSTKLKL
ncbi:MAG: hypothetical protein KIC80_01485 [Brachyspira sp.]|nr:hypothetical protein [Brachyspira sp.]